MPLLPDPDNLLAVADRISRHATALRRHAQLLAASVSHTTWHGAAAHSFAHEAMQVCASLRRSADRLDAAAGALRHHAARVRAELHLLARVAGEAAHAADTAVHVAGHVAGRVAGGVLDAVGI